MLIITGSSAIITFATYPVMIFINSLSANTACAGTAPAIGSVFIEFMIRIPKCAAFFTLAAAPIMLPKHTKKIHLCTILSFILCTYLSMYSGHCIDSNVTLFGHPNSSICYSNVIFDIRQIPAVIPVKEDGEELLHTVAETIKKEYEGLPNFTCVEKDEIGRAHV